MNTGPQNVVVLNPGHFHAALTLRQRHPMLADDVYVYSDDGDDLDRFLSLVQAFNDRAESPTGWRLHVRRGDDHLERLRRERPGDLVVVAGRNDTKMASIHALHADGFRVLGDKPWVIDIAQIPLLAETMAGGVLAMDIMTERHEVMSRLQRVLSRLPEVFGAYRWEAGTPAIEMESVHHLFKLVNGKPLVRPAWYFDVAVQGEGITDVTTHLVDLTQWMTGSSGGGGADGGVELVAARQWTTDVPRDAFGRITGLADFPPSVRAAVSGDVLKLLCNAQIDYRLGGVPARVVSLWNLAIPDGGGDTHHAVLRGTRSDIVVDQGPQTGFRTRLRVFPHVPGGGVVSALAEAVVALQREFPGLSLVRDGEAVRLDVPARLHTTHEEHFAKVLDEFLGHIRAGAWPETLAPDLLAKYTLLAQARELANGRG